MKELTMGTDRTRIGRGHKKTRLHGWYLLALGRSQIILVAGLLLVVVWISFQMVILAARRI